MLDEMSFTENLHFSQKFDCIDVCEDLGSQGRTSNNANHALFFMLRGLRKRWKQPVAYYLVHGSTKCEMLINLLKEVLDVCHDAGLEVVATMCDMGANNVKALKLLRVLKRHLFSGFMIKKLQLYLVLPISLNVPLIFSSSIIKQMWSVRLL